MHVIKLGYPFKVENVFRMIIILQNLHFYSFFKEMINMYYLVLVSQKHVLVSEKTGTALLTSSTLPYMYKFPFKRKKKLIKSKILISGLVALLNLTFT